MKLLIVLTLISSTLFNFQKAYGNSAECEVAIEYIEEVDSLIDGTDYVDKAMLYDSDKTTAYVKKINYLRNNLFKYCQTSNPRPSQVKARIDGISDSWNAIKKLSRIIDLY